MTDCRRFKVEGRVQGVWFRESTRQQAAMHGITGYARNCPDGSVEVLACGSEQAVSALRNWLRRGPPMAQVTGVQEFPSTETCEDNFTTG